MSFYRLNRRQSLGDVHLGIPHFFKYFFGWWCWVYFVAMNDRLQFGDLLMDEVSFYWMYTNKKGLVYDEALLLELAPIYW